jgi:hypothetical protein
LKDRLHHTIHLQQDFSVIEMQDSENPPDPPFFKGGAAFLEQDDYQISPTRVREEPKNITTALLSAHFRMVSALIRWGKTTTIAVMLPKSPK